jgi:hypothetical protein
MYPKHMVYITNYVATCRLSYQMPDSLAEP